MLWWKSSPADTSLTSIFSCDPYLKTRVGGKGSGKNHRRHDIEGTVEEFFNAMPMLGDDPFVDRVLNTSSHFCNGNFVGYAGLFAKLLNVVVDISYGTGRKGGEHLSEVLHQPETKEFYTYKTGFFQLPCSERVQYPFMGDSQHLNAWMGNGLQTNLNTFSSASIKHSDFAIAITRYEYVNFYHTMTDFYNVFLMLKLFQIQPGDATILWIDGHPKGGLDATWRTLFGKVYRVSKLKKTVQFKNMVWSIVGYESPLDNHRLPSVPYLEEFRQFFLSQHRISLKYESNCDKLNILIIWRHNYVAHPRNPTGSVSRKIKNEDELLKKISESFPTHNVKGIQIDALPMQKQLEIIARTDILIGMHGAGLSHTLFLPRHSGLVEMFPAYYTSKNRHFRAMACWRNLLYSSWENKDYLREFFNKSTNVDQNEVAKQVLKIKRIMCKRSN
ncbi:hypothetical protein DPMN_163889 [Dreissena polymorpha]|uniref:EGF domain-specific O-linked N-acetylglucosamine transferase n=1 Tax=Dreissena polymorpha TaxID=45954 RepID=A0A9D4IT82_DREPO|nr:hypothetical protein DPMN_163889 [Dreissena polymorpha]